jgi:hypothetical protein
MGGEEEHDIATLLFWKLLESRFDILGDSLVWDTEGHTLSGRKGRGQTVLTSTKPGCVPQRSMTLQLIPENSPALLFL